uniref:Protein kinase domain-containing protein n=1 Tax=Chromera velia CCMP2878 TaxID=1169474 RepID=A0A0G4HYZ1_9ALVE|eukprot:Cvel_9604.t1-p1 / transcript=Cvel_9604.t1 / gene=Cvel_9604 / organism=Chromera_velia_CCMP2878 / gene_product=Serine/threonine-protein kinase PK-1, putative / transcript_product=Serine/threonine-protein kinase PK-1, putative / location=Cvel_scaffold558:11559-17156(-) / protein_length=1461 / sequence_SO=supercontig / SO=protein_coding / is_pseudo=false
MRRWLGVFVEESDAAPDDDFPEPLPLPAREREAERGDQDDGEPRRPRDQGDGDPAEPDEEDPLNFPDDRVVDEVNGLDRSPRFHVVPRRRVAPPPRPVAGLRVPPPPVAPQEQRPVLPLPPFAHPHVAFGGLHPAAAVQDQDQSPNQPFIEAARRVTGNADHQRLQRARADALRRADVLRRDVPPVGGFRDARERFRERRAQFRRCHAPNCQREGRHRCAVCRAVYYCGRACQRNDWPFHRTLCNAANADAANSSDEGEEAGPRNRLQDPGQAQGKDRVPGAERVEANTERERQRERMAERERDGMERDRQRAALRNRQMQREADREREALRRRDPQIEALDRELFEAAGTDDDLRVMELIRQGASVHSRHYLQRWTPLHNAASRGSQAVIDALLAAGADPTARTEAGRNAMQVADMSDRNMNFVLADPEQQRVAMERRQAVQRREDAREELQSMSLGEIAACLRSRLLRIRREARGQGERNEGGQEDEGLSGLPVHHWTDLLQLLRTAAAIAAPPSEAASSSSSSSAAAASSSSSSAPLPILAGDVFGFFERTRATLSVLSGAQSLANAFQDHQAALAEKVTAANRDWGSAERQEEGGEGVSPVSDEEVGERNRLREETLVAVETALQEGQVALESFDTQRGREAATDVAVSCGLGDFQSLLDRLEASIEAMRELGDIPRGGENENEGHDGNLDQPITEVIAEALSLAEAWQNHRAETVRGVKVASEEAMQRAQETMQDDLYGLSGACTELERVEREEGELRRQMRNRDDPYPYWEGGADSEGGTGKDVVKRVLHLSWVVRCRLRSVAALEGQLNAAVRALLVASEELLAGVSAVPYFPLRGESDRLGRFRQLLGDQKREQRQIKRKERELQNAIEDSPSERQRAEVARLERELEEIREAARENEFPERIREERVALLSQARRLFPELLWEGGDFLRLVRLDVQDIAQPLLQTGILLQARPSDLDFSDQRVISEPGPQSGSQALVSEIADREGTLWILKRYEIAAEAAARHFYRQVEMVHELRHPHIVPVHAVWQEGTQGFVQMPQYLGGDLGSWMAERPREGGRDPEVSLRIAEDLLSALSFLHQKGKVHCDVKPQNIFLTERSRAVLGDFDGVKDSDPPMQAEHDAGQEPPRQRQRTNQTTVVHITGRYVAPEILQDSPLTPASDIYSAGTILCELLGGGTLSSEPERAAALNRLARRMRSTDPSARPTVAEALQDRVFVREEGETARCVTCFETFLRQRGVSCTDPGRHFICCHCLNRFIESSTRIDHEDTDVRARFLQNGCRVACQHAGCTSAHFPPADVSFHLRPAVHAQWEDARTQATEMRVRQEMEPEIQERIQRAQREPAIDRHMREIEEALTLKCPDCRAAFVDFDACAALQCAQCGCRFCAYCQQRGGHEHVHACPEGEGLWIRREQWERLQRRRHAQRVRQMVDQLAQEERGEVLRRIQPLLRERRIRL